jgi:hypothetical protein
MEQDSESCGGLNVSEKKRKRKDVELRELAIARAEEAAKYHGLACSYEQDGVWITFETGAWHDDVRVKARGWMNASNAFVRAVTEWAMQKGASR